MKGQYYLARIIKINLSQDQLMDIIVDAPTVSVGKFDWTITDVIDARNESLSYVFGKFSKYSKEGAAKVIDEESRSQVDTEVPNLLLASSPFVYLPGYSGIAFMHVWNGIELDVFPKRFKSVIEKSLDSLLVACDIEPIADYRAFVTRLRELDIFTELDAVVHPPNPLFGRLWGSLKEYVDDRNASEVKINEKSSNAEGLDSEIISLVDNVIQSPEYEPKKTVAIGDAAILMAADGYGRGKVVGIDKGKMATVKTSDSQKSFQFEKEPSPEALALEANSQLEKISTERDMKH